MTQEWKVCTLDQAKKLVKLGIVMRTETYWVTNGFPNLQWFLKPRGKGEQFLENYPAYDVAELGLLLPDMLNGYYLDCGPVLGEGEHRVTYHSMGTLQVEFSYVFKADTEAQARCATLIWLLENKHLEPGDLKL